MYVRVEGSSVTVHDADDLTRLNVECDHMTFADIDSTLRATGAGELVDADAMLSVEWLHTAASAASNGDAGWTESWERMIEFAAKHGWVSADGSAVRAHIEGATE